MNPIQTSALVRRLLTLGCLWLAFAGSHAVASGGGGSPDPGEIPVLQALRVQISGLDQDFLAVTGIVNPQDLPVFTQLADELARIDAHFALAAVGGGSPDPAGTALNLLLLAVRAEAYKVREHVGSALGKVSGNSSFVQITKALRFMHAAARMIIARVDYALPVSMTPPPDL